MRYLLDTHTIIWYLTDYSRLPVNIENLIDDLQTTKFVSIASVWEVVIKLSVNRLSLNLSIDDLLAIIQSRNIILLPIHLNHLREYTHLPFHHRDPFDRLLIATAVAENLTLVTSDKENQLYDVNWVWEV